MSRIALFLVIALAAASCQNRSSTDLGTAQGAAQARFYHDGQQKPTVALVPIFDHTSPSVEWNLSDEMTHTIADRLLKKDKLFLTPLSKILNATKNLQFSQNPFSLETSWIKPTFAGQDFVVFMELIEHDEKPIRNSAKEPLDQCASNLDISVRVRVFDLRGEAPRIVLQEIVNHRQHLPRQFTKYNFHQEAWGHDGFTISPLGLAHAQLTKEIASRIEDYVLMARN